MFNETESCSLREFADTIETLRPKIEPAADDVMASIASARRSIESVEGDLTAGARTSPTPSPTPRPPAPTSRR